MRDLLKVGFLLITYVFILLNISKLTSVFNGLTRVIMPFIFGFVIAYLLNPFIDAIKKLWFKLFKKELKHRIAMLISYVILVIVIGLLLLLILPEFIVSVNVILTELPEALKKLYTWIATDALGYLSRVTNNSITSETVLPSITSNMTTIFEKLGDNMTKVMSATMSIANLVFNFALGIVISIYMLSHKDKYKAESKKILYALFSDGFVKDILDFFRQVNSIFSKFIVAKIIDSVIIGLLCYVGCLILHINNALIIAVIVGVTNIIPYFGPFIGAVPSALIVLLQGVNPMVVFIIFTLVLQQFDGNILGPKLLGDSLGLTSLWIIFAVLVMIALFGVVGMFIGVPLFAVIYMMIKGYIHVKLQEKNKSTKTEDYM